MSRVKEDSVKGKAGEARGPNIRWDGSKMKSAYANVCNVTSTREEVTLLFGTNQTWSHGSNELVVDLSDRIILNPYAAKRLSLLLQGVVAEYEKRFGAIHIAASAADAVADA